MLLFLLLAAGAQNPGPASQNILPIYYSVAAAYRMGHRDQALGEIRQWRPADIRASLRELEKAADALRVFVLEPNLNIQAPVEIDTRTVEAAALMHVEAGLLELQSLNVAKAEVQFSAASSLVDWSHELKSQRLALLTKVRRIRVPEDQPDRAVPPELTRALSIDVKIERHEFYVALAAATLSLGFPKAALTFADKAQSAAPLDGEGLLVSACVRESLAREAKVRTLDADAQRLHAEAEALFRETLAADPTLTEARVRLAGVLLDEGRPREAVPLLEQAVDQAADNRQRYLALLFLGRAMELQDKPGDGVTFYRRAVDAWPESQAARLALARGVEASAGAAAARELVMASLLDSSKAAREPDPWWSYTFGPRSAAKALIERLWQTTLGRSFGS